VWLDGDVVAGGVSDVSRMLYVRAGSSRPVLYRTAL
jgi:hypothetical protein